MPGFLPACLATLSKLHLCSPWKCELRTKTHRSACPWVPSTVYPPPPQPCLELLVEWKANKGENERQYSLGRKERVWSSQESLWHKDRWADKSFLLFFFNGKFPTYKKVGTSRWPSPLQQWWTHSQPCFISTLPHSLHLNLGLFWSKPQMGLFNSISAWKARVCLSRIWCCVP